MVAKISITHHGETDPKQFTKDEKDLSLDDLIDKFDKHLKFQGMDTEFYLPDPQDTSTLPCLCNLLHEDIEFQPKTIVAHFHAKSTLYDKYSMNNMQYSYKALLSILDDSLIKVICPCLPKDMKYGPILWTLIIHEVQSASFQCVNLLKQALVLLCFTQTNGENVTTFTNKFLQICNDLGKNVPSKAPFLLNKQLSTASVEQFHIKFTTKSTKVNDWVCQVHGMSHDTILSMSSEPNYISIEDIIIDTCEEHNILLSANHWGPSLFTKVDINTLVQKQIFTALNNKPKPNDSSKTKSLNSNVCCHYCKEHGHVKNDCPKLAAKKAHNTTKPHSSANRETGGQSNKAHTPAAPWKAIPPTPGEPETKIRPGIGVQNVASGNFLMELLLILMTLPNLPVPLLLPQPIYKTLLFSMAWSCLMNDSLTRFFLISGLFGLLC